MMQQLVMVVLAALGWLLFSWYYISIALVAFVVGWLIRDFLGRQPCAGAVLVTGADSGMGRVSAIHLAAIGYHVFAGCYSPDSPAGLLKDTEEAQAKSGNKAGSITPVLLDVTKDESIQKAKAEVEKGLASKDTSLVGLINCAGVGFTGPSEYFPMDFYKQQMEVNFFGYVAVAQAFLPLIKQATKGPNGRRGRVVFVGTGGGVMSPAPALLSAYMASKWAGEAFIQSLRIEMQLNDVPIDACMVNPGFIKPTALMDGGKALLDRMWKKADPKAKEEYGKWVDRFLAYSEAQPGTHPRCIAKAMENIMSARRPYTSYKVGPDSQAAPFAGILPPVIREFVVMKAMFQK